MREMRNKYWMPEIARRTLQFEGKFQVSLKFGAA
jgi:hypothetical protein